MGRRPRTGPECAKVPASEFLPPQGSRSSPNTAMSAEMQAGERQAPVPARTQPWGQLASPNTSASGHLYSAWPVSRAFLTHVAPRELPRSYLYPETSMIKGSVSVSPQSVCSLEASAVWVPTAQNFCLIFLPICNCLHREDMWK